MTKDTDTSTPSPGLTPTPFVGPGQELERLQDAWDQVEAGNPRLLVWTADTGLGNCSRSTAPPSATACPATRPPANPASAPSPAP